MTYDVEVLDGRREVGVLLVVEDDGRLEDVSRALDVHPRPVHRHQVDALQLAETPEQDLKEARELVGQTV